MNTLFRTPASRRLGTLLVTASLVFTAQQATANADEKSKFGIENQKPDETSKYNDNTPALHWAIRNSFLNYVGQANHILDGAREEKNNGNRFAWPFKEFTEDKDKKTATIKFGGTVNFLKYCNGNTPERGKCELDFTLGNPEIVYHSDTGQGELYAKIHTKDYSTKQWTDQERVHFGNLNFNAGRYRVQGEKMHWSNVAASLTAEGNKAFSNFYHEGGPLADLSFSFTGKVDVPKRDTYFSVNERYTDVIFNEKTNRLFTTKDGHVVHVAVEKSHNNKGKIEIFNSELTALTHKGQEINIAAAAPAALDTDTDTLYWSDDEKIYMANITNGKLGAISNQALGEKKTVSGLVYSPQKKQVAVLYHDATNTRETHPMITTFTGKNKTKDYPLPERSRLYEEATFRDSNELWGPQYSSDGTYLQPLPDGTFLFAYDYKVDNKNKSSLPLHITLEERDGKTEAKAQKVEALQEQFKDKTHIYRSLATDNKGNIALYNNLEKSRDTNDSRLVTLEYKNKNFTVKKASEPFETGPKITGAAFSDSGELVVISEDNKTAYFLDPATHAEKKKAPVSPQVKDTARTLSGNAVFGPDKSLYLFLASADYDSNANHHTGVQRLASPETVKAENNALTEYNLKGHEPSEEEKQARQAQIEKEKADAQKNKDNEKQLEDAKKQAEEQQRQQQNQQQNQGQQNQGQQNQGGGQQNILPNPNSTNPLLSNIAIGFGIFGGLAFLGIIGMILYQMFLRR